MGRNDTVMTIFRSFAGEGKMAEIREIFGTGRKIDSGVTVDLSQLGLEWKIEKKATVIQQKIFQFFVDITVFNTPKLGKTKKIET